MKVRLEILLNPPEITYIIGVFMNDDRLVCRGDECRDIGDAVASAAAQAASLPNDPIGEVARRALELLGDYALVVSKPRAGAN